MFKILNKIKEFIDWDHSQCYNDRENEGIAVFGMCCGLVGGTKSTNYLQESCIDCRYYCDPKTLEIYSPSKEMLSGADWDGDIIDEIPISIRNEDI